MIRYHLDENVSPIIAEQLRKQGFDVTTSQQVYLLGEPDDSQLDFAISQQRTIVTFDDDFTLSDIYQKNHFGVCYCHCKKYSIGKLVEMLLIVEACFTEEQMKNHIEYL